MQQHQHHQQHPHFERDRSRHALLMKALSANLREVMVPDNDDPNNVHHDQQHDEEQQSSSVRSTGYRWQKKKAIKMRSDRTLTSTGGGGGGTHQHQHRRGESRGSSGSAAMLSIGGTTKQQQNSSLSNASLKPHDVSYTVKNKQAKKQLENLSIVGAFIRAGASEEYMMEKFLTRTASIGNENQFYFPTSSPTAGDYGRVERSNNSRGSIASSNGMSSRATNDPRRWNDPSYAAKKRANMKFFGSELSLFAAMVRLGVDPADAHPDRPAAASEIDDQLYHHQYRNSSIDTEIFAEVNLNGPLHEILPDYSHISMPSIDSGLGGSLQPSDRNALVAEILRIDAEFDERTSFKFKRKLLHYHFLMWRERAVMSRMDRGRANSLRMLVKRESSSNSVKSASKRRHSSDRGKHKSPKHSPKKVAPLTQPSFVDLLGEGQKLRVQPRTKRTGAKGKKKHGPKAGHNLSPGHRHQDSSVSLSTIHSEGLSVGRESKESIGMAREGQVRYSDAGGIEIYADVDQFPRESSDFAFELDTDNGNQPSQSYSLSSSGGSKVMMKSSLSRSKRRDGSTESNGGQAAPSASRKARKSENRFSNLFSWRGSEKNQAQSGDERRNVASSARLPGLRISLAGKANGARESSQSVTDIVRAKRSSRGGMLSRFLDLGSSMSLFPSAARRNQSKHTGT